MLMVGSHPAIAAPAPAIPRDLRRRLADLSDARLCLLWALVWFVLAAWPLLLVEVPPFQDLPNHLATAHIVANPALYPQYAFNGFWRSNSLLTLWLAAFGGGGLTGAARAFVACVLALNALALPFFVLRFAGRGALAVAMLFVWPLVHGFAVSMGFLNFAAAFALSLILLTLIDRQRESPTLRRGAGAAALAGLVWYAHPFPLAVVGALVALHVVGRPNQRARIRAFLTMQLPLVPAGLLSLLIARQHLLKAEHAPTFASAAFTYLNPWELVAHLWLDASGALTRWGSMTIVPALLLFYFAWRPDREDRVERPLLSRTALAALAVAYLALPVMLSNWNYLNCRLVPFLWVGLALRLPRRLPPPVVALLAACALSFSVVLGVDYLRLDRDRAELTAGIAAVPARATLLPLLFKQSKTSDFTASLTHAWGYYTLAKDTSAPLVFAVERSYPITYREFPPRELVPPALDQFAERNGTPAQVCKRLRQDPDEPACTAAWRELWSNFWRQAEPRFSHLLTWAMPADARAMLPAHYHRVFAAGELEIYARETQSSFLQPRPGERL
jgi:hypothetical protein